MNFRQEKTVILGSRICGGKNRLYVSNSRFLQYISDFCVEMLNPMPVHCICYAFLKLFHFKHSSNTGNWNVKLQPMPSKIEFDENVEEKNQSNDVL